jgi:dUTP pyrophosphatase
MNIVFEKLIPEAVIPTHAYGNQHDNVGMDLFAGKESFWFKVSEGIYSTVVKTGLRVQLPSGYHIRVASRSGLAFKNNIFSYPGTIDSSYRGEIMLKLIHFGEFPPEQISAGDKVAQAIIFRSVDYEIIEGVVSEDTERAAKGFGSSG